MTEQNFQQQAKENWLIGKRYVFVLDLSYLRDKVKIEAKLL